ncbi:dehypoxanthine futalosine cyclase [Heliobacterium gestii]|uniref:Cyclic dehypoxanthine futalosine synthase n=1 Tax=Heliomicrobium gestii TaxID=2699 RepID=A0A845LFV9_HELGE|nr:cyclic dehypoxanthinyl futalosine synthase [Heliomicrobium gestii]MBM7865484.1 cyclic dehypoxanthinyl futalosine synthase [Heliomicrobium gestii]MZP41736.1 dehypoxanthine futalosine cyclase [Heliomicrobium gestii]
MRDRVTADWQRVLQKARRGERLSLEEGVLLLNEAELLPLGAVAREVSERMHPGGRVTFVIDRNINYTNICVTGCRFCAFYRSPGHREGYVLSQEALFQKIEETVAVGGTQILMQGGIHPELGLEWFEDLLRAIKARFSIHIHSFSPPEIVFLADKEGLSLETVIGRLHAAGLDSIPGGGAEILDDRVRQAISPRKIGWRRWMDVMQAGHRLGLRTTATMMYGSVESPEERIRHMIRVREAQDETGGFTAFIPWSYQPAHTELGGTGTTGVEYLKTLALSRLMLDNVANIQASWVTQGAKMGQVALAFGANDFGGTMLEENVVRAAGVRHRVPMDEIVRAIRDAGKRPAQRDTLYHILREF